LSQLKDLYNKIVENDVEEENVLISVKSDNTSPYQVSVSLRDNTNESIDKLVNIMIAIYKEDVFKLAIESLYSGFKDNNDLESFKIFQNKFLKKLGKSNPLPLISPIVLGLSYDKND
jgi:hypothetical protein